MSKNMLLLRFRKGCKSGIKDNKQRYLYKVCGKRFSVKQAFAWLDSFRTLLVQFDKLDETSTSICVQKMPYLKYYFIVGYIIL
jgi:hypothetical protein